MNEQWADYTIEVRHAKIEEAYSKLEWDERLSGMTYVRVKCPLCGQEYGYSGRYFPIHVLVERLIDGASHCECLKRLIPT